MPHYISVILMVCGQQMNMEKEAREFALAKSSLHFVADWISTILHNETLKVKKLVTKVGNNRRKIRKIQPKHRVTDDLGG